MLIPKYIPLTFVKSDAEISKLIQNSLLLLQHGKKTKALSSYIEGTQYGYNASAKEHGSHPFVRISDITDGKIDWNKVPFCECDNPKTYLLQSEDILIARTGGTTGKSFRISKPSSDAIYAGYLIRIRATAETNPAFLEMFLNSYQYWGQVTSLNRDEFRPSVNAKKLSSLRVPDLSREQQDSLVAMSVTDSVNPLISKTLRWKDLQAEITTEYDEQKSLLTKLKQAILQEAIQGKLTADWRAKNPDTEPASELLKRIQTEKARLIAEKKIRKEKNLPEIPDEEIPFEIPEGWKWTRMGLAGIFERGKSKHRPRNDNSLFDGGKIPFVQTGDVARSKNNGFRIETCSGYYNQVGLDQSRLWEPGTMCITIAANIAETGFLTFPACIPDSVVSFTPTIEGKTPQFLRMFIELTRTAIEKFAPATAQKNINLGIINQLLFPLPPLAEQAAIVSRVEALMATCRELETEIENSRIHAADLLQAVLKEAFSQK